MTYESQVIFRLPSPLIGGLAKSQHVATETFQLGIVDLSGNSDGADRRKGLIRRIRQGDGDGCDANGQIAAIHRKAHFAHLVQTSKPLVKIRWPGEAYLIEPAFDLCSGQRALCGKAASESTGEQRQPLPDPHRDFHRCLGFGPVHQHNAIFRHDRPQVMATPKFRDRRCNSG